MTPEDEKKMYKMIKATRNNSRLTLVLLVVSLVLALVVLTPPTQAQTIALANPMGLAERDIIVYWPNGSMQGYYNSTSVIELDNTSDYIFALKPVQTNPLEDPGDWLTNTAFPFVESNTIAILVIMFCIGALLWRR